MNKAYQTQKALWYCQVCSLWWLSEPQSAYRWRLSRLTTIKHIEAQLARAPAWNVCGPSPAVCLECGTLMAEQSLPDEMLPD